MYDKNEKCGAWMIDFSKTIPVSSEITITHRSPWQLGNHEDGFLVGLDNLILVSIICFFTLRDNIFLAEYTNENDFSCTFQT